jgi:hypothetical protein
MGNLLEANVKLAEKPSFRREPYAQSVEVKPSFSALEVREPLKAPQ